MYRCTYNQTCSHYLLTLSLAEGGLFSCSKQNVSVQELIIDLNVPKNALNVYPEIPNLFPKNPCKHLKIS